MKCIALIRFLLISYIIFCLSCPFSLAQQPTLRTGYNKTYFYAIDDIAAGKLFTHKGQVPDSSYFKKLVYVQDAYSDSLPLGTGNYLKMRLENNELAYEYFPITPWRIYVPDTKKNLIVQLLSVSNNKPVEVSNVKLGKKYMVFDNKTQVYLAARKREGIIEVTDNGYTFYYKLDKVKDYNPGFAQKIKRKFSKYNLRKLRDAVTFKRKKKRKLYASYFYFNKPIYREGDTIKFKAHLLVNKNKGLWYHKPLKVYLDHGYNDDPIYLGEATSKRKGAGYNFEFVIRDSMDIELDDEYSLLMKDGKDNTIGEDKFKYENYELQKAVFDINLPDGKEQYRGKPFGVSLTARDENGLPMPDTRVAITLTTTRVHHIQPDKLFTPDTLWSYVTKITKGESYFIIPDSIFPLADVDYELNVVMQNSENEYSDLQESIEYKNSPGNIRLELIEDSISITKIREDSLKIHIYAYDRFSINLLDTVVNGSIKLPLNTHAKTYFAETDQDDEELEIESLSHKVTVHCNRTKDSLFLSLENPRNLNILFHIYRGKKKILSGTNKALPLSISSDTRNNYYVMLEFVWAGKIDYESFGIPLNKNNIRLRVDQPAIITPGKGTQISITATDIRNKPVSNLNILAYSYTQKFGDNEISMLPLLGIKSKWPKSRNSFKLNDEDLEQKTNLNYSFWNAKMLLDSNWTYRFLYPPSDTLHFTTIPSKDSITQFAPFVMAKGAPQAVQYIFLDNIPVYFGFTRKTLPYSFETDTNYHQLKIRTTDKLLTIDSIKFKPGNKTLFSIDQEKVSRLYKVTNCPDTFTEKERNQLAPYVMKIKILSGEIRFAYLDQLQGNTKYIDLSDFYNRSNLPTDFTVGPVYQRHWKFQSLDNFERTFEYEPFYTYTFTSDVVKMKSNTIHELIPVKTVYKVPEIYDEVLHQEQLYKFYNEKINEERRTKSLPSVSKEEKTNAKLTIDYFNIDQQRRKLPINIILGKPGDFNFIRVYSGNTREINNLQPGQYQLLLIGADNTCLNTGIIEVKDNGNNFYRITQIDTVNSNRASQINDLLQKLYQPDRQAKPDLNLLMNEYVSITYYGISNKYSGTIIDKNKEPIIAASVRIERTSIGTISDLDGNFEIDIPEAVSPILNISSPGYESLKTVATENMKIIMADELHRTLQEVLITIPYGPPTTKEKYVGAADVISNHVLKMSPSDITKAIESSIRGVQINQSNGGLEIIGQGASSGTLIPLIIIDGAIYNGDLATLDPVVIASFTVLKDATSTSIYGARGSNGVLLITTKKGSILPEQIRKGLIQTEPVLPVDMMTSGLRNLFRDDTYWQPDLVTDKEGKAAFTVKFPDDITNWRTLVFATDDKMHTGSAFGNIKSFKPLSASLHLPRFLLDKDTAWLLGKSVNYIPDTIPATTSFYKDNQLQQEHKIMLGSFHNDTIPVSSTGGDSLTLKYLLSKEDGYFDGEERSIPIHRIGSQIATGSFLALDQDTTFTIYGDTIDDSLHLRAAASLTDIVLEEIKNIEDYRYLCNEQIASKILAMLYRQNMYTALGKPFTEKEKNSVQEMVYKLLKKQNTDHQWGWWESSSTIPWISDHVLHALLEAQKMGYEQSLDLKLIAETLLFELERDTANITIPALNILKQTGAVANFEQYIRHLERKPAQSINDHLALQLLRMQLHLPYRTDKLKATLETDIMGNIYWADTAARVYGNEVIATVNALKIIQQDSSIHIDKQKIVNWLLQQRGIKGWRNTYESAKVIEAIAPYLPLKNNKDLKPELHLSGGLNEQVSTFPYHKVLATIAPVTIHKSGALPIYFTWYRHHWDTTNTSTGNNFRINTGFGTTQTPLNYLQAGEPTVMKVKVEVLKSADYVMIEIPIPAGCSYQEKPQPNSNHEIHREYFDDKVSIFCEQLPKGTYEYEVTLLPRYQGSYTLNPAKAELMYFPVFYGRAPISRVQIKH